MKTDYNLFFKFIDSYAGRRFADIDPKDPLNAKLEEAMVKNRQFLYVADLIQMKILHTSQSVYHLLGTKPEDVDPHYIFEITHPDDIQRHATVRGRLIKQANELFVMNENYRLMSTNLRANFGQHEVINLLHQAYMWHCHVPTHTVCGIFVQTDISWFGPIGKGYHAYIGTDLSKFRYPDKELIMTGYIFSEREYEIIKLTDFGLSSEEIAAKVFLSPHTVNTHRRNILKKSGKKSMPELIYDMRERGLL